MTLETFLERYLLFSAIKVDENQFKLSDNQCFLEKMKFIMFQYDLVCYDECIRILYWLEHHILDVYVYLCSSTSM